MFKRSSANYSLWPEQARPRRGMSLSLAAGGFAVGIVCAIAAVNVTSQYVRPMAMEEEPVQNAEAVRTIPVYSAASTLVTAKAATSEDEQSPTRGQPRSVAKVALPTIGRAVPVVSETDGRGGDPAVKMPPVRLTDNAGAPAATVTSTPKLIRNEIKTAAPVPTDKPSPPVEETKVASREPAPEAATEPAPEATAAPQPAARSEPRARSRAQARRAERSRSQPSRSQRARAERRRNSYQPSYAARYRAGPVYGANGAPINGYFSN